MFPIGMQVWEDNPAQKQECCFPVSQDYNWKN